MESLCIPLSCIITPASRSVISISFFACSVLPLPLAQSVHGPMRTHNDSGALSSTVHIATFSFHLLCTLVLHFQHSAPTSCCSYIHVTKKASVETAAASDCLMWKLHMLHVPRGKGRACVMFLPEWEDQFWLIRCVPIRRAPCRWRAVIANATSSVCPGVPQSRGILFH